jgi:hypothetical protein
MSLLGRIEVAEAVLLPFFIARILAHACQIPDVKEGAPEKVTPFSTY